MSKTTSLPPLGPGSVDLCALSAALEKGVDPEKAIEQATTMPEKPKPAEEAKASPPSALAAKAAAGKAE